MKILIITGPTASGKTDFAIQCAKKYNGEIISCDSMQIYKKLDIGTAKATPEEQSQVKHHLIDIVEPSEEFSVQEFVSRASKLIEQITSVGKLPIIVGGTGLYIKSLIYPYSFANAPKDETIRKKYNEMLKEKGKDYIYQQLIDIDKESASKIHKNDVKKVIRALEICELTGNIKSQLKNENTKPQYEYLMLVLSPDRQELYAKINKRVDIMFDLGLENEVKNLVNTEQANKNSQSMQAIGYKEFFDYFDGKITIENVKELIKQHSRNYAKRQVTFFKPFKEAIWLCDNEAKNNAFLDIEKFLVKKGS